MPRKTAGGDPAGCGSGESSFRRWNVVRCRPPDPSSSGDAVTPPKQLVRVEWTAARIFTTPDERRDHSRNFYRLADAAEQVAVIQSWPFHMHLNGVYRPRGYGSGSVLAWDSLDPLELVADHLAPFAADQIAMRIAARLSHPDPEVRASTHEGITA